MSQTFTDLCTNIKSGFRLCLFRRPAQGNFRISADQIFILFILGIMADLCRDYLINLPNPSFNLNAIPWEGLSLTLLVFSCFILDKIFFHQKITFTLSVIILSMCLVLTFTLLLILGIQLYFSPDSPATEWIEEFFAVWALAILILSIRTIAGHISIRVVFAFFGLLLIWVAPINYYASSNPFWHPQEEEIEEEDDFYEAYENLDVEGMYYAQPKLLAQALKRLSPGQKGNKEVFFIGMGAWAFQDVFLKETLYAKDLFDHRFESQNRSLVLINHLTTHETIPLATSHNLKRALNYFGSIMNSEEDLLILYMTSHGSKDHKLSVNFWPLSLNDISPEMVRQYLNDAGIQWKVIMISACYSGGFIEPLKTPYTAIASAAAPDRKSFGCGNKSQFTYFGEALLKDQLQNLYSFPQAFSGAIKAIGEREAREGLEHSLPQSFIGKEMDSYLEELSTHLIRKSQRKLARGD